MSQIAHTLFEPVHFVLRELLIFISTLSTTTFHNIAMSTAELAASYAALILADDGVEITVCQKVPEVTRRKKEVAQ